MPRGDALPEADHVLLPETCLACCSHSVEEHIESDRRDFALHIDTWVMESL